MRLRLVEPRRGRAAQAAVLLAVGGFVLVRAVRRLVRPEPVASGVMLVVGLVGLAGNTTSLLLLARRQRQNLNSRAAFLEVVNDALGSLAVLAAAVGHRGDRLAAGRRSRLAADRLAHPDRIAPPAVAGRSGHRPGPRLAILPADSQGGTGPSSTGRTGDGCGPPLCVVGGPDAGWHRAAHHPGPVLAGPVLAGRVLAVPGLDDRRTRARAGGRG